MTSNMDNKFLEISSVQNGLDSDMNELESEVDGFEENISKSYFKYMYIKHIFSLHFN